MNLLYVCKVINRQIGKTDPFSDIIFHPWEQSDGGPSDDWIDGPGIMDGTIRLTFYAVVIGTKIDDDEDPQPCGINTSSMWIVHVHKATGHVMAMKVQEETEPSLSMTTISIKVPELEQVELRNI